MNIFENAKFGGRFRTRDGKIAILVDCEIKLNGIVHFRLAK